MTVQGPRGLIVSPPPATAPVSAKEIWFAATNYGAVHDGGSFRVRNVAGTASFSFTFFVPSDFVSLSVLEIDAIPNGTNVAATINFFSEYGAIGELYNQHTESQLGGIFSIVDNTLISLDISGVFTSLSAGDRCGLEIDHVVVGSPMDYIGIRMVYTI